MKQFNSNPTHVKPHWTPEKSQMTFNAFKKETKKDSPAQEPQRFTVRFCFVLFFSILKLAFQQNCPRAKAVRHYSKNEDFLLFGLFVEKWRLWTEFRATLKLNISINTFTVKWFQNWVTTAFHSASPFFVASLYKTRCYCQMDRKLENKEQVEESKKKTLKSTEAIEILLQYSC